MQSERKVPVTGGVGRTEEIATDRKMFWGKPLLQVRSLGAGDGIRTRDINLGKVALYQLSYSRSTLQITFSNEIVAKSIHVTVTPWFSGLGSRTTGQRRPHEEGFAGT